MWRSTGETSSVSPLAGDRVEPPSPKGEGKGAGIFDLAEEVVVDGKAYRVRTDYRVILEIFIMLNDPELSEGDKTEALLRMFYVDRPTDTKAAIHAFADFVEPRKRSGAKGPGLVDWENDFDLIVAPVNRILGTECRTLPYLHWRSFLSAYMEISSESLFARVISIRDKLKNGKKLEKWERNWYRHNRDLVDLPMKFSDSEKAILEEWT